MSMSTRVVSRRNVFLGVSAALALGAIPFAFKNVRQRENQVAAMRDAAYDAKDAARDSRLSIRRDRPS
jgi:hypothetical protein